MRELWTEREDEALRYISNVRQTLERLVSEGEGKTKAEGVVSTLETALENVTDIERVYREFERHYRPERYYEQGQWRE